jgi:hypothetical protein
MASGSDLNFGRSWRNLQFLWWGWRSLFRMSPRFAFQRAVPPLDETYRWFLFLGPMEVRRWAEDWRDLAARRERERWRR